VGHEAKELVWPGPLCVTRCDGKRDHALPCHSESAKFQDQGKHEADVGHTSIKRVDHRLNGVGRRFEARRTIVDVVVNEESATRLERELSEEEFRSCGPQIAEQPPQVGDGGRLFENRQVERVASRDYLYPVDTVLPASCLEHVE
jgi:hypothetical protein